jgi:hypothetical protein
MEDSYEDGFDQETPAEPTPAKVQSKQNEVSEKENMIPLASLDVPLTMLQEASSSGP